MLRVARALVQWLKLPAWKVGDCGLEPHSGLQIPKKQNDSSLTLKYSILWGASVIERWRARPQTTRARISNPVSEGQCHLIHLTILRKFSWPRLAQRWLKTSFISFFTFMIISQISNISYQFKIVLIQFNLKTLPLSCVI